VARTSTLAYPEHAADALELDLPKCAAVEPEVEDVVRPKFGAIMRHLGLSIMMANVIPSVLFYLCLVAGNVWTALIAALVWC
jgi:hypothetical protein